MLLEALLVLKLSQPPAFLPAPLLAKSFSSSSSRSFSSPSSSRSSFSSPSRSLSPSSSFSSPSRSLPSPSKSLSSPTVKPSKPASPPLSTPSVQRIEKQRSSPAIKPESRPIPQRPAPPPIVTRETYVERYSDSNPFSSPWFWMWALDNDRQQQPAQVIVNGVDGEHVKVPSSELVVKRNSWNPVREFFVFVLGGGIGVLVGRRFSL